MDDRNESCYGVQTAEPKYIDFAKSVHQNKFHPKLIIEQIE